MRAGTIGLALCVLAGLCMVAGLAVDIDSTAAKLFILASAVLFVPGVLLTFVWMRVRMARRREGGRRVRHAPPRPGGRCRRARRRHRPGARRARNLETEPIGPGSATMKIKDGGGTHGVVTATREADLVLDISLRLRALLRRAGVAVVMTRTRTAGPSMGNIARARIANRAGAALFLRPRRRSSES